MWTSWRTPVCTRPAADPPAPAPPHRSGRRGRSLVELLVLLTLLLGLGPGVGSQLLETQSRARLRAGARAVAARILRVRSEAALRGRYVALRLVPGEAGWTTGVYLDGDGDGVWNRDIDNGTDPELSPPGAPSCELHGVFLGFAPLGPIPVLPPGSGQLETDDPVRFGASNLISCSPLGTCSSGSLYLSDGRGQAAVRLFGPTARLRLWELDRTVLEWRPVGLR